MIEVNPDQEVDHDLEGDQDQERGQGLGLVTIGKDRGRHILEEDQGHHILGEDQERSTGTETLEVHQGNPPLELSPEQECATLAVPHSISGNFFCPVCVMNNLSLGQIFRNWYVDQPKGCGNKSVCFQILVIL